jgi:hypothetical protein
MIIEASELAAALADEGVNAYVLIAKFARLYVRANDIDDRIAPHLAHIAFLLYNAGIIQGRAEAAQVLQDENRTSAPKKGRHHT